MSPSTPPTDRERLEALRDHLEAVLNAPETSARDTAAVSRELRQTIAALSQMRPAEGVSKLDEVAARRRRRGAS